MQALTDSDARLSDMSELDIAECQDECQDKCQRGWH